METEEKYRLKARLFINDTFDFVPGINIYFIFQEVRTNVWEFIRNKRKSITWFDTPEMYLKSEDLKVINKFEATGKTGILIDPINLN